MSSEKTRITRRSALMAMGAWGTAATVGPAARGEPPTEQMPAERHEGFQRELERLVDQTPLVDTHEHLPDEEERLRGEWVPCDDWSVLFSHYLDSDLATAGMPDRDLERLLSRDVIRWPSGRCCAGVAAVKNTVLARAGDAMQELYDIDELNEQTVARLQAGYEAVRKPGFYQRILVDLARIESCQVDSLGSFRESRQPLLLMQDLNFLGMHMGPDIQGLAGPPGKEVRSLDDGTR